MQTILNLVKIKFRKKGVLHFFLKVFRILCTVFCGAFLCSCSCSAPRGIGFRRIDYPGAKSEHQQDKKQSQRKPGRPPHDRNSRIVSSRAVRTGIPRASMVSFPKISICPAIV